MDWTEIYALARAYTNRVALGQGAIQGPPGVPGAQGTDGADGLSAYEVWLAAGNVGTVEDFLKYITGPPGADGTDGQNGVGVPVGGMAGQILKKASNDDFNTEWADARQIKYIGDIPGIINYGTRVFYG